MNDSLAKLLGYIEPKIFNIQENRIELKALSEVYKTITELVDLGKKSYLEILDYYDQEFIYRCIKIDKTNTLSSVEKYKTSRYLLKNQNQNITELPQYKEALDYIKKLSKYLLELYENIKKEYETKSEKLQNQELLNKYYLILKKENVFIEDVREFLTFLDLWKLDSDDKLNILMLVTKSNVRNYVGSIDTDTIFNNNISLSKVKKMLEENSFLIDENLKYSDEPILENGQFNEENFNNKKKYLITKVKNLLDLSKYDEMVKYYLEYSTLLDYYQEFKKQKKSFQLDNTKKLIFMMDGSKSLIQKYLELCKTKYQGPILKNLLDIEKEKKLLLPDFCYKNNYLYIKDEFVVKVVYTYLDSGYVLVLGVLDKNMKIETFISNNKKLLDKTLTNKNDLVIDNSERDLILKNIKVEDLVLTIDLNTLDVKMEEENAR